MEFNEKNFHKLQKIVAIFDSYTEASDRVWDTLRYEYPKLFAWYAQSGSCDETEALLREGDE